MDWSEKLEEYERKAEEADDEEQHGWEILAESVRDWQKSRKERIKCIE